MVRDRATGPTILYSPSNQYRKPICIEEPSSTKALPIDQVRAKFPGLREAQVFLDNAGGSQTLGSVITTIHDYLSKTNVQLGASYTSSKLATDLYYKGYQAGARYINAPENSIVIGASTTQLFRNLSYALTFPAGSEIIISNLDHEANIASWLSLAKRQSLVVKWWKPTPSSGSSSISNPKLTPENLSPLLSDKTVLVACTHASNILGTIHDIKALASTLHTRCPEAFICVDAVAYAPHRPIDVVDLGVDFYSFSWYKLYGPHIAQLYASERALQRVESLAHYFNLHSSLAEKLGLAASSYELVAAVPAVVQYFEQANGGPDVFWSQIRSHEERLQGILLEYLNGNDAVTVLGERSADPMVRVPTVSFVVRDRGSRDVVEAIDGAAGFEQATGSEHVEDGDKGLGQSRQFGIRWGHFYSKRLCEDVMGLPKDGEGVVRVSMVHYNTEEEVKSLVVALRKVIG